MSLQRFAALLVCLSGAAPAVWAGTEYRARPGERVVANEIVVRMKPGVEPRSVISHFMPNAFIQPLGIADLYRVRVPAGTLSAASSQLAAHPLVDFVEPNRVRSAVIASPNDTSYSQANQWGLFTVQALQAWSLMPAQYFTSATASTGRVRVAVLDTGADCTHPDFVNAGGSSTDSAFGGQLMWSQSKAEIPTTVPSPACPWQDDYGHGTHVTGIIAAATNNSTGVAALGYPLQVIEFKILDHTGTGDDATVVTAISDAITAHAQVISMSFGENGYSQSIQLALNFAWQKNIVVVAAAGNFASNTLFFPAGSNYAVGVSATDSSNNLASFSNYGNSIQLAAPGVGILSTFPTYTTPIGCCTYGELSGTSMATPFVSALAGLIATTTPNTSATAIVQRMEQTAASSNAGGGWGQNFGYGIINAYNAIAGTARAATNGGVIGQIIDAYATADPISAAQITIDGQTITTDSAPTGLYRFASIPAGTYPVRVSATGYPTQNLTVTVAPGADTNLTIAVGESYGEFLGQVTDQGNAVAGAIVQALSGGLIVSYAVTDTNGNYSLWVPGNSGVTYNLATSAIGFSTTTSAGLTVAAGGSTSANLNLPRLGSITGAVTDATSLPVPDAQVFLSGTGYSAAATTNGNGVYLFAGVPGGAYSVTASIAGLTPVTQSGATATPDTTDVVNLQFQGALPRVPTPVFNPPGGSFTFTQAVTITSATGGASIRYTTDGTLPSETNGTLYNGAFAVNQSATVKAIASLAGFTDSPIASASFTITPTLSWYNTGWGSRKAITINGGQVSGVLANFPMLYSVTDANLVGNTQANGNDILFTASDGVTKLNHEIESYNSGTGKLVAWVEVPAMQTGAVMYLYYGNAGAGNQQNGVGVWDGNYEMVWHLNGGTTAADSTSNGDNGKVLFNGPGAVAGKIGGGAQFVRSGVESFESGGMTIGAKGTVEFWVNPADYTAASDQVFANLFATGQTGLYVEKGVGFYGFDLNTPAYSYANYLGNSPNVSTIPVGSWTHVVYSWDDSAGSSWVYLNGTLQSANVGSVSAHTAVSTPFEIGGSFGNAGFTNSSMDEVRYSNIARNAAWVGAEYANANTPSSFYSVGAVQSNGGGGTTVAITVTSSPGGLSLTVDNTACTAPCSFQWMSGSIHTIAVTTSPQAGSAGTQYVYSSWSDGLGESHTITVPGVGTTYTAGFGVQYYLTTSASSGGSILPASEWVGSGTGVTVTATANTGFTFSGYTGALTGTTASQSVTMNAPATVTANFAVSAPSFSLPGGPYTSAQTVTISTGTAGASIRYTTNGTPPSETVGTLSGGSVTVSSSETLMAIAYKSGYADSGISSASYTINLSGGGPSWYNTGWGSRKAITINSGQVSGVLANFPMLYSVTDANLVGNTQANGNDILFTASDGVTKLNHEIESYNSGTGKLVAWVEVPAMQTGAVMYLYYGNAGAGNQQNGVGVWDGNYEMVWHLNGGTTAADSTSNGDNGKVLFNGPGAVAGKIGGGAQFVRSGVESFESGGMTIGAKGTVEFWVNPADYTAASDQVFANLFATGQTGLYVEKGVGFYGFDLNTPAYSYANYLGNSPNVSTIPVGSWTHVVYSWDDSAGSSWVYLNGTLQSANVGSVSAHTAVSTPFEIGGSFGNAGFTNSSMDEVRYSNIARNAAWVGAEYANANTPSSFYSVGAVQSNGGGGTTVAITVTSSPGGLSLTVDNTACTAPCSFQWMSGSIHTIAVTTSPQAGSAGTQYVYSSWSDGLGESHTITVPGVGTTYTAGFGVQYYLTTSASSGGSILPASEWVGSGTGVTVTATANTGFTFSGYTGALTGTTASQSVTMNAPATVTANFAVSAPSFSLPGGPYTSAQTVTISTGTAGASIRYTTNGTPPSETVGTLSGGSVTVSSSETLMAIAYKSGYADSGISSASYTINLSGGGPSWYNTGWGSRKAITINSGQVSGVLANFPMLYSVTDANLVGNTQANGNDILFTASDGVTKLNHEIESYNSGTGKLVAWVEVPAMQTGAVMYLYYGNAGAGNQQNGVGVWDGNYEMVWHLNGGTTAADSTSNGDNGKVLFNGPGAVAGKIGGGAQFVRSGVESFESGGMTIGAKGTVEFWVNPADYTAASDQVFANLFATGQTGLYVEKGVGFYGFDLNTPAYSYANYLGNSPNVSTIPVGSWTHVVYSWDDSAGSSWVYLNGTLQSANVGSVSAHTAVSTPFEIGGSFGNAGFTNSSMDEVRYSNIARSAAWVAAEYNNQSSPSTFYSVGAQQ